jgi:integrase
VGERERRVGFQAPARRLASVAPMATGIRTRHARSCRSRDGGGCNCTPTYQAQAYDARTGRQVWRTFPTRSAAKLWRQDAQVALRRGTMRPPTAKTIAEAAEVLIAGAHDGTILDRGGKPYKPSTARGYEQLLRSYVVPALGGWKLTQIQRRDVQDFVDDLRKQGLSASTIANILDPLRVIFRRAIRRDELSIDPTDNLDLPAIRGRRDRIEPPERAHEYLAALPDSERAFWAVALFCGLRRGELRGLQWINVGFDAGVIRVERSWDPVKGPVDVKTGAGRRAVPMAFVVRRELMAHKARTGRDGPDLVFGRTATEAFFASTIRARANKAWKQAGLEPLTPHEARHCAISYFIAAGLDWKQISTWAGHGDVRQTWNRYGHLVPGGEEQARQRLDAFLAPAQPTPTVAHTVAHAPINDETPENTGVLKYRYRDSNPGFRREREAEHARSFPEMLCLHNIPETGVMLRTPPDSADVSVRCLRDDLPMPALGGRVRSGTVQLRSQARPSGLGHLLDRAARAHARSAHGSASSTPPPDGSRCRLN